MKSTRKDKKYIKEMDSKIEDLYLNLKMAQLNTQERLNEMATEVWDGLKACDHFKHLRSE
jgi:hypothetical protein